MIWEAEEEAAHKEARTAALEEEAKAQNEHFMITYDEWNAHLIMGIAPSVNYEFSQFFQDSGNCYQIVQFFRGARVFDPSYVKKITSKKAKELIDLMACYPRLVEGSAENTLIYRLKKSLRAYKQNAQSVGKKFSKCDKGKYKDNAILTWHYNQYLRIDEDRSRDFRKKKCRYCGNKTNTCKCHNNYGAWFEAACLVTLVMPSSAAAERVFSLLHNFFGDERMRSLSDSIFLSLCLSTNKRSI